MDVTQITITALTVAGAGLVSWGVYKTRNENNEKKIESLNKQINGNGQEGIIIKVVRVETRIDDIANDIKEIKELLR